MTWNNRIMRHKHDRCDYYQMHEVYYDKDGKVDGWTENPKIPYGENVDELIEHLEQLLNDAKKCKEDVLDYDSKCEK